jgi:hypothetical protein
MRTRLGSEVTKRWKNDGWSLSAHARTNGAVALARFSTKSHPKGANNRISVSGIDDSLCNNWAVPLLAKIRA